MYNDFEVGNILQYEDDSIGKVVVLGNYLKDDSKYSLVCPIDEEQKDNFEVDITKSLVLNVEKNGDVYVVSDRDLIDETIFHILDQG